MLLTTPRHEMPDDLRLLSESAHGSSDGGAGSHLRAFLTTRAAGTRWTVLALAFVTLACGITAWLGVPHVAAYGHDSFIALDGAWRVLNGQKPHVDFFSAFGPVPYLIAAGGLKLAALGVEGLADATAAVGLIVGLWGWGLVRTRFKAWAAFLALAYLLLFWLAPFPLGESFFLTGYAMQYNRLGYVLAAVALLELYTPSPALARNWLDWGGFSTGIAIGLLCFLKISFFFVVCAMIAGAYILERKGRTHFVSVVTGFALIAFPMLAYLDWDVMPMLRDLSIAMAARQVRFTQGYDPFRTILRNLGPAVTLFAIAYLARLRFKTIGSTLGLAAVVVTADLALAISNTQRQGFPLSLVAILIIADRMSEPRFSPLHMSRRAVAGSAAAFALVAAVSLMPVLTDTANGWGIVLRSRVSGTHDAAAPRFDAPHLSALVLDDHDEPGIDAASHNGAIYTILVNEGIALLRRTSSPRERIACLWFANPFSYALLRPPAEGGSAFYAYGVNISADHAPTAARILGNADLVIYPKTDQDDPELELLRTIAGPDLVRDYRPLAESAHWALWRRK